MAEASFQSLTLNRVGDFPFDGELKPGEWVINLADGRIWVGNDSSVPIELGGNCKVRLFGNSPHMAYRRIFIGSSEDLPLKLGNPSEVREGTYEETQILIKYPNDQKPELLDIITDYPITWEDDSQDPLAVWNQEVIFKVFAYGPQNFWYGQLIWAR